MKTFEFTVTVEASTYDEALRVMQERILHDEDYGFDYSINYEA